MVPTFGDVTIYLCRDPVDFRLGINGLSTMVEATLKFDPFSRNLFCFVNRLIEIAGMGKQTQEPDQGAVLAAVGVLPVAEAA